MFNMKRLSQVDGYVIETKCLGLRFFRCLIEALMCFYTRTEL